MIERETERIISPQVKKNNTDAFENTLRPQELSEYIGQKDLKKQLHIAIQACKKRKEPLEHMLFYGPPGLGKTTLSMIISKEMGVGIKVTSGPAVEKQGDLASILTNLQEGDILFIDEIHRLKTSLEEILYSAMEDFVLDLIIGKGPSARTMRMNLPRFTLVGATTKVSLISSPLRDRFGHIFKLNFYTDDEMTQIVKRSAGILETKLDEEAASKIASCSRATPRIANRLLKRVRDFAEFHNDQDISFTMADQALKELGVDPLGLDLNDRGLLKVIIEKFQGGPVGLSTLAAATAEDADTIEDVYEPFLMQMGLLERTHRGRMATRGAYEHLGLQWIESENQIKLPMV